MLTIVSPTYYLRRFEEVGRTEVAKDTINPAFSTCFELEYTFDRTQSMALCVYDEDCSEGKMGDDYLGAVTFTAGEVMGCRGCAVSKGLVGGNKNGGVVVIRGEEVQATDDRKHLEFILHGSGLKNKDGVFGKSDPYLIFKRKVDNCDEEDPWTQVWKSEIIQDNLNPRWAQRSVELQKLCNCELERPLRIEIWDYDMVRWVVLRCVWIEHYK